MKIMVISDIHANFNALSTLSNNIENADYVLCLGDIVGYNTQVNEVIDYLRNLKKLYCVLGNHDDFLLRGCPPNLLPTVQQGICYADNVIRPDNRHWLAKLPIVWAGLIENLSFFLVHGSPWNPFTDYLYADNPLLEKLNTFNYDIIAFGQTHRALVHNEKKPYLINPGSVGQSRDKKGFACALEIETDTMTFTRIERPYANTSIPSFSESP